MEPRKQLNVRVSHRSGKLGVEKDFHVSCGFLNDHSEKITPLESEQTRTHSHFSLDAVGNGPYLCILHRAILAETRAFFPELMPDTISGSLQGQHSNLTCRARDAVQAGCLPKMHTALRSTPREASRPQGQKDHLRSVLRRMKMLSLLTDYLRATFSENDTCSHRLA